MSGELASRFSGRRNPIRARTPGAAGDPPSISDGDEVIVCIATHRREKEHSLREMMAGDPQNMELKASWIALQSALAQTEIHAGNRTAAALCLLQASKALDEMMIFDSGNRMWADQRDGLDADLLRFASLAARE